MQAAPILQRMSLRLWRRRAVWCSRSRSLGATRRPSCFSVGEYRRCRSALRATLCFQLRVPPRPCSGRVIDEENFGPRVYSLLRDIEASVPSTASRWEALMCFRLFARQASSLQRRLGGAFTPPPPNEDARAVVFLTEQAT